MAADRREFIKLGGTALAAAGLGAREAAATSGPEEDWPPSEGFGAPSWSEIRRKYFTVSDKYIYANNSTLGATLKPVQKRMEKVQKLFSAGCPLDLFVSEIIMSLRPIYETMARVVNSPAPAGRYVGSVTSVTEGMSLVANGLSFGPGDTILITDHEHTGGKTMWELQRDRYGARVVTVPLIGTGDTESDWEENLLGRFRDALAAGRAKVLSFPWITTSTGHILPAKELCALAHEHGAISVIDAAQAFAVLPIDLVDLDCDFLVANGHKYLCGPIGSGFMCVNPRQIAAVSSFWPTVVDENYYSPDNPARHYPHRKGGVTAYTNVLPLQEALSFYETVGPFAINARLFQIGDWLRTGLAAFPDRFELITPRGQDPGCVMTCFRMAGAGLSSEEAVRLLMDGYAVQAKWATEGGADAVRLSPHYYTKVSEMGHIAKALCSMAGIDPRSWFSAAPLDLLRE